MRKARTIAWLLALVLMSIAGTVAFLKSQPPRFEQVFHRVCQSPGDYSVWLDNDTLLFPPTDHSNSVERLTLSTRALVVDPRLTSALGAINRGPHSTGDWIMPSPDGKWLLLRYEKSNSDFMHPTVRIISSVDGRTLSIYREKSEECCVAWLPDSKHWVEVGWQSMTTHDLINPESTHYTPVRFQIPHHPSNGVNPDGTYALDDPDMTSLDRYDNLLSVTPDGRILYYNASIDLMSNPVAATHAVNMPADVMDMTARSTFLATYPPLINCDWSYCPTRRLVAYELYDSGRYQRNRRVPSWVPIASRPSLSYRLSDFSGRNYHLLAVADCDLRFDKVDGTGSWSPDGKKLLVQYKGAIWEANVD